MDTREKRFSVIVPAYNVEKYLPACLDSLLAQTFDDFEVLVVDDVSTDGTKAIAHAYAENHPDKIQVLEHTVNTRQGGARNTGIEKACGQYILFLDSDDYFRRDTLQLLWDILQREKADIIEFCHDQVDARGNLLRRDSWPRWLNVPCSYDKPLLVSGMGPCNKVYHRDLFADGSIRFPVGHFYEDYWTVPKLLMRAKKVYYLDEPLYCYRQLPGSTTHAASVERNRALLPGTDALLEFFRDEGFGQDSFAQLEYLATEHVLINATLRVNGINRKSPLQRELRAYMYDRFPHWKKNPWLYKLSPKKQMLLKWIDGEKYGTLYLLYHMRNQLTGRIKSLLHCLIPKRI